MSSARSTSLDLSIMTLARRTDLRRPRTWPAASNGSSSPRTGGSPTWPPTAPGRWPRSPSCASKPGPSAGRADGIEHKLAEVSALLSRMPTRIDDLTAARDRQDDKVGGQARREGAFGRHHVLWAGDADRHVELVGGARRGGGRRLACPGRGRGRRPYPGGVLKTGQQPAPSHPSACCPLTAWDGLGCRRSIVIWVVVSLILLILLRASQGAVTVRMGRSDRAAAVPREPQWADNSCRVANYSGPPGGLTFTGGRRR